MADAMTIPVVFLMGPTASGKTALALEIARDFGAEIISVDAAQVYQGMDIGTAKASPAERALCPHHLIDIRTPDEPYSVARFRSDALALIEAIRARGRLPVLAGGTMFYFHALLRGLPELPASDSGVRAGIARRAAELGWPALHDELADLDPRRAGQISRNDSQRIARALEINALSGANVAARPVVNRPPPWPLIRLALAPARREDLHRRIEERFRQMLEQGLVSEVAGLLETYAGGVEPAALKMVGYRQVSDYLAGQVGYNRMMEAGIAATRRLAKRQLTWLRNQAAVTWIDSGHPAAPEAVREYLQASPRMAGLPGGGRA